VIWEPGDALAGRAVRFASWGEQLRLLDPCEARTVVGPHVRIPPTVDHVVHTPAEGWIDAVSCTYALIARACELGAELIYGQSVTRLEPTSTGGWRASLSSGQTEDVDVVVNATGTAVGELAPAPHGKPQLVPNPGLLGEIICPDQPLRVMLHSDQVSIRPAGGPRILCRSDQTDRILVKKGRTRATADLLRRIRDVLPHIDADTLVRIRIGHRVMPPDGLPKVGAVPGHPGYHQIISHSGIILGPLIGRLLAIQITTGKLSDLLTPYALR
jgi:glycine/D-amino acid oxidase-like deaminating enzyme